MRTLTDLLTHHAALEAQAAAADLSGELTDDRMDALSDAIGAVELNVLRAPCTHERDILDKLEMARRLIDLPGCIHTLEVAILERIADDLRALRARQLRELLAA